MGFFFELSGYSLQSFAPLTLHKRIVAAILNAGIESNTNWGTITSICHKKRFGTDFE
jgi:hypothetical protein